MTNTFNSYNALQWQYYAFTDEPEYRELQGKHAQLCRRFANMTRKDPNFNKTLSGIEAVEAKIADKQKDDWLMGCDDTDF
jgi:hypothetical protein